MEVPQTYSPVLAIWEVYGTLWKVPRCDVTAMASVDWLEGRVLVILLSCLVLLSICSFFPSHSDHVSDLKQYITQER